MLLSGILILFVYLLDNSPLPNNVVIEAGGIIAEDVPVNVIVARNPEIVIKL